jgi:hypothetical protein
MEGTQFDTLSKWLASTPLTRATALRGLAAGAVVALTGVSLTADDAGADRNRPKKVQICHRGDDASILGTTKKVTKKLKKNHLRKHAADYTGKCTAARMVPRPGPGPGPGSAPGPGPAPGPGECVDGTIAANGQVCVNGAFEDCTSFTQCGGKVCLSGRCTGGQACDDANDVCRDISDDLWCDTSAGAGTENICVLAESNFNFFCEDSGDCSDGTGIDFGAEAFCLLQGCTRFCDNTTPCTGPFDGASCVGNLCLF